MWICNVHLSNTQTVILPVHFCIFLIFFSFLSVQENNTIWDRLTSGQSALTLLLVSTDIHTSSEKHRERFPLVLRPSCKTHWLWYYLSWLMYAYLCCCGFIQACECTLWWNVSRFHLITSNNMRPQHADQPLLWKQNRWWKRLNRELSFWVTYKTCWWQKKDTYRENLFKKSVGNTDIYWRSRRLCSRCRPDGGGWSYQGWSSPAGTSGRRLVSSARWGLIPAAGASERSDSGWSLEEEKWSEISIIGGPDVCRHVNSFWRWFSGPDWSGRWRWYSPVTWATTAWEIRLFARKDLISSLITELSLL